MLTEKKNSSFFLVLIINKSLQQQQKQKQMLFKEENLKPTFDLRDKLNKSLTKDKKQHRSKSKERRSSSKSRKKEKRDKSKERTKDKLDTKLVKKKERSPSRSRSRSQRRKESSRSSKHKSSTSSSKRKTSRSRSRSRSRYDQSAAVKRSSSNNHYNSIKDSAYYNDKKKLLEIAKTNLSIFLEMQNLAVQNNIKTIEQHEKQQQQLLRPKNDPKSISDFVAYCKELSKAEDQNESDVDMASLIMRDKSSSKTGSSGHDDRYAYLNSTNGDSQVWPIFSAVFKLWLTP